MKAVMIVMDQAHYDRVVQDLASLNIRGFTSWKEVYGKEPGWDTTLRYTVALHQQRHPHGGGG